MGHKYHQRESWVKSTCPWQQWPLEYLVFLAFLCGVRQRFQESQVVTVDPNGSLSPTESALPVSQHHLLNTHALLSCGKLQSKSITRALRCAMIPVSQAVWGCGCGFFLKHVWGDTVGFIHTLIQPAAFESPMVQVTARLWRRCRNEQDSLYAHRPYTTARWGKGEAKKM